MGTTRIALAQINSLAGDLKGNAAKILGCAKEASRRGASLLVTPEFSLCGAPLGDLADRAEFQDRCREALEDLSRALACCPDLTVVVGFPERDGARGRSSAAVLDATGVKATSLGGRTCWEPPAVRCGQYVFRIVAGEDDGDNAVPDATITLCATPFFQGKGSRWESQAREKQGSCPGVWLNAVGGEDAWVFDGGSFAMDAGGHVTARLPEFQECVETVVFDGQAFTAEDAHAPQPRMESPEALYRALLTSVRDYVGKNRFPGVLLGLSGGVDSALVACIAVDALGADKVRAVMMPTKFTSSMSLEDARTLARRLGIRYDVVPIESVFSGAMGLLSPLFEGRPWDATEENLQARIRGMILMALSNKTGSLVLTTGNKSECAVGYSTLYGDTAGGFAVLGDVLKTRVYELCRLRNRSRDDIPERILTRAPSAELREDQKDQDSLPDYAVLDEVIRRYVEERERPESIACAPGMNPQTVWRIIDLIHRAEYKRRQGPIVPKMTPVSFGCDWHWPVTGTFR